jgi:hypothetical protein
MPQAGHDTRPHLLNRVSCPNSFSKPQTRAQVSPASANLFLLPVVYFNPSQPTQFLSRKNNSHRLHQKVATGIEPDSTIDVEQTLTSFVLGTSANASFLDIGTTGLSNGVTNLFTVCYRSNGDFPLS